MSKNFKEWLNDIILTEGMKTEEDMPEDLVIHATIKHDATESLELYYSRNFVSGGPARRLVNNEWEGLPYGNMQIIKSPKNNFWNVYIVKKTTNGWGPLLYDLAMEYATKFGDGLTGDQERNISSDAKQVWTKYRNRDDIERNNLPWPQRSFLGMVTPSFLRPSPDFVYRKPWVRWPKMETEGKLIVSKQPTFSRDSQYGTKDPHHDAVLRAAGPSAGSPTQYRPEQ